MQKNRTKNVAIFRAARCGRLISRAAAHKTHYHKHYIYFSAFPTQSPIVYAYKIFIHLSLLPMCIMYNVCVCCVEANLETLLAAREQSDVRTEGPV